MNSGSSNSNESDLEIRRLEALRKSKESRQTPAANPVVKVLSSLWQQVEDGAPETHLASDDQRAAEAQELINKGQMEGIVAKWNAPAKQVRKGDQIDRSGRWGKFEQWIIGKLGSGFLMALVGGSGPGKTQMGVEIMRHRMRQLVPSYYTTATSLFIALRETGKGGQLLEGQVLKRMQTFPLLVIDEIDKRGATAWEDRMLVELLNRRYADEQDTLLIGNQPKDKFVAAMEPSICSRMLETGGIVECNWPSFRKGESV